MKDVILDLEFKYFAKHANLFPITGETFFMLLLIILKELRQALYIFKNLA